MVRVRGRRARIEITSPMAPVGGKTLSIWHRRSHRAPGGAADGVCHGGATVGHAAPRARRSRVWTVADPQRRRVSANSRDATA